MLITQQQLNRIKTRVRVAHQDLQLVKSALHDVSTILTELTSEEKTETGGTRIEPEP